MAYYPVITKKTILPFLTTHVNKETRREQRLLSSLTDEKNLRIDLIEIEKDWWFSPAGSRKSEGMVREYKP